jgi:hypothetical protein
MIVFAKQSGHSVGNGRIPREKGSYAPPRVSSETEILLEENLLGGSIMYSTWVEIAGQGMKGLYFENGDIVTDDNYWGE